ncbi:MAG TPA: homocysteine S-methyltransferase family protein, partial [Thermodesulfobacteriota bacterium]|nr:homocysteine S-methyltransferase family protein [Thermodesulfobacteriota bacterium]
MNESFLEKVGQDVMVMSGAMGTMLHGAGATLGGCIGEWIVDHPEVYRDLVEDYFQVGCDIVAAATFALNRISLAKFELAEKVQELNWGVIRIIKDIQPNHGF